MKESETLQQQWTAIPLRLYEGMLQKQPKHPHHNTHANTHKTAPRFAFSHTLHHFMGKVMSSTSLTHLYKYHISWKWCDLHFMMRYVSFVVQECVCGTKNSQNNMSQNSSDSLLEKQWYYSSSRRKEVEKLVPSYCSERLLMIMIARKATTVYHHTWTKNCCHHRQSVTVRRINATNLTSTGP